MCSGLCHKNVFYGRFGVLMILRVRVGVFDCVAVYFITVHFGVQY